MIRIVVVLPGAADRLLEELPPTLRALGMGVNMADSFLGCSGGKRRE